MAEPEQAFPSTTWEWRRTKIRRPAGGQEAAQRSCSFWWRFPQRDARRPLTLSISYRGGPEAWYEIHARGSSGRFPGYLALHDVMRQINEGGGQGQKP